MTSRAAQSTASAIALAITLGAGAALPAFANGLRNPYDGASAIARPGGKIVFTDDASAVIHNPANLAAFDEASVQANLMVGYSGAEYDGVSGSGETEGEWKVIPSLFYAKPCKGGDYVFGIGVSSPFGQSTEWKKDGPFAFTAPYFAELTTIDVSPVIATKLNDKVMVGGGLDILYSELTLKSQFPFGSILMNPAVPPGFGKIETYGVGVGAHLGVTVELAPRHRVAALYKSPIEADMEGDFDVRHIPPPLSGDIQPRVDIDTEIDFPTILALGYGFDVNDDWRVGADVEWVEFSSFESLPLDAKGNQMLLPGPSVPQNWDDTWTFGLGAEWDATDTVTLRGGYLFLESPIPEETIAPTLPDVDRHLLSVGARTAAGRGTLDVAYSYSIYDDLEVNQNVNPAYIGEYDLSAHLLVLSYNITL